MKKILLTFILAGFIMTGVFSQYYNSLVRIDSSSLSYRFHVTIETPKPHLSYKYFWFSSGRIHQTVGGYDGKLLHGEYKVTDPEQRLLEQGNWRMGRKWGNWYTWYPDGKLKSLTRHRYRSEMQFIEEYDAQGNRSRKGYIKKDQFTGQQQVRIKDSTIVVTYKNGIPTKNSPD
jgi:antitoxin component YwqK of YwqJK toxin-antitoxin module